MSKNISKKSAEVFTNKYMGKPLKNFGRFFVSSFAFVFILLSFLFVSFALPTHQVYAEGSFVFTGHLELGVVSNDVKELQTLLNSKGYNAGIPDGKFGPITKEQVVLFQKDNGLKPDGVVGERVRAFLNGTSTITPTVTSGTTPAVSSITSSPRTLKLVIPRIKGDDVKDLQTFLNNLGYNTGTLDGIFGPKTEVAVKLFQIANNLTPDGKVGKITRNLISTTSVSNPQGTLSISGCNGKIGYSIATGVSCSTVFLPIGCNSSSIYSTSTGLSCATGLPPASIFKIVQFVNMIKRDTTINTPTITGVTVPTVYGTPTSSITTTDEYTATISWTGSPAVFTGNTAYTATITLTAKSGYTLSGVTANYFTVAGATSTNAVDSGVITAVFPSTPFIQLTISNPTLTTLKAYDGGTTAVVSAGILAGVTSGETVTVTALANYDTKDVGTDKTITVIYTLGGADAGHYIKPADHIVSTGIISKADGPAAPSAPTLASKTATSITLASNALNEFSNGGGAWQSSEVFTGLTPLTSYTFTARVKETSTTNASLASVASASITTLDIQATPTFSPNSGAITLEVTPITITSAGADNIYYTTDGTTPTTGSSSIATGGTITLASISNPIKAYAVKSGYTDSAVGTSGTYTQNPSADLTSMVISDSPANYTFGASTYTYNGVTVLNAVASITITPTGTGTITVDGTTVASGSPSGSLSLTEGVERTIPVVVTEAGKSSKTYTIKVTRAAPVYALRQTGPGGGLVFYVTDGGIHGLEATLTDQSTGIAWITGGSTQTTSNGNTGTAVGTGQANTNAMMAQTGYTGGAAKVCDDLVSGTKSDWFLPSKNELNLMYTQLKNFGVGGFSVVSYWSSSEYDLTYTWHQIFNNGAQYAETKSHTYYVRAVRAF